MADWLHSADVVVTKAGPGTIAEAACCGAAMLLTSHVPGQEAGNARLVASAGAGRYAPRPADLMREVGRLRRDPGALAAMRAASARLGRPGAAMAIATVIAGLTDAQPAAAERPAARSAAAVPAGGEPPAVDAGHPPEPVAVGGLPDGQA